MKDIFVDDFINETFNQDENDSAILKVKCYNPPNQIFQVLPVREKIKKYKLIG